MKKILISACLLGENCKYNGLNNKNDLILKLKNEYEFVPVCPEMLGGLPCPRCPSEIINDKVINKNNDDVTNNYLNGAEKALEIALKESVDFCILKEKSPSCGVHFIYDGTFENKVINGSGITSRLLSKYFPIYSEFDFKELYHKTKTNYHSHTSRCNHATGEDEEYVLKAIENHYQEIGFSDHMPVKGIEKEIFFKARMPYSKRKEYINSVLSLKEKYKDRINILLAYECEYFKELDSYYKELLDNEADYLIFGNHFMYYENNQIFNHKEELGTDMYIEQYKNKALAALRSGYFKIMAHPDFYLKFASWSEKSRECAYAICKEAKKYNVILEINEMCFRRDGKKKIGEEIRYGYPTKYFFEIAKEIGNTFIIGVDAHNPKDYDSYSHIMAISFAKELDLKVIDRINFKK